MKVKKPILKKETVELDEELLVIKQQLLQEDVLEKNEQKESLSNETMEPVKIKIKTNQFNIPKMEKKKKKNNRNDKVGINMQNDYAYMLKMLQKM